MIDASAAHLVEVFGYAFGDAGLLELALTHPSFSVEAGEGRGNERLEFLGDAVLDLVVAELLFERHPSWDEGRLTRARAALVNQGSLSAQARELQLGAVLRLGRTELRGGGAEKDSILANVFEALLGALYLDGGLAPVRSFLSRRFAEAIESGEAVLERDPKSRFQEWAHARFRETPRYREIEDTGIEDDADRFTNEVTLADESWGRGSGRTKRAAEKAAAVQALKRTERATASSPAPAKSDEDEAR